MEDIEAFLAVIEAGGQTAAARQLGRSLRSINQSLVSGARAQRWCRTSTANHAAIVRDGSRLSLLSAR
jgi:plasmid stabilization system protein ParE